MSPGKRRFSSIIIFTVIIMLVVGISSGLYFFKIKKNDDYQNQLHFRELNDVAHNVRSAIQQFASIGRTVTDLNDEVRFDKVMKRARDTSSLANVVKETNSESFFQKPGSDNLIMSSDRLGIFTLNDGFSYYVGKDQENTTVRNTLKAPTQDFLPSALLSFPMVLMSDENGNLVARKTYLENSTNTADLEFTSVSKLLLDLHKQQVADQESEGKPSYSGTIDKEIAGVSYRIFIQPISVPAKIEETKTLYLLGFTPLTDMQIAKLSVSSNAGLWIFISLLLLSSLIPILKIRFTSIKTNFSKTDISLFFAGCILFLGIATITINHQLFYSYLLHVKHEQAESIFTLISGEFKSELTALKKINKDVLTEANFTSETSLHCKNFEDTAQYLYVSPNSARKSTSDLVSVNKLTDGFVFSLDNYLQEKQSVFVEGGFRLNHKGLIPLLNESEASSNLNNAVCANIREPILRISESAYNFTDFSLAHREYFQKAIRCDLWFDKQNENVCEEGVFIQRIKNVSDARLSTQLSFADFESMRDTPPEQRKITSLSIKLTTFFSRVMPRHFGYAVFDERGEVLYHSDDNRALLENILVETNNDKHLTALIDHQVFGEEEHTASFTSTYRNAEHVFVGGNLSSVVPWKLVVFYNVEELAQNNLWLLLVAVVLFIQLMAVLIIWNRFIASQLVWSKFISFCPTKSNAYAKKATLLFGCTLFLLMSLGLVVSVTLRLLVWLALAVIILYVIAKRFDVLPSRALLWRHPMSSFVLLFIIVLLLFVSSDRSYAVQVNKDSLKSFGFGLFVLLITLILTNDAHVSKITRWWRQFPMRRWGAKIMASKYLQAPAQPHRYSRSYVIYIVGLLWFFSIVPAAIFINASNHYLLSFQAYEESNFLLEQQQNYKKDRLAYQRLMRPEIKHDVSIDEARVANSLLKAGESAFPWIEINMAAGSDNKTLLVDPVVNELMSTQSFGGNLNQSIYHFAQNSHKESNLIFDGNQFLLSAVLSNLWLVLLSMPLLFLLSYRFVKGYIVQRMMGEHLPDNFRLPVAGHYRTWQDQLKGLAQSQTSFRVQLLRTNISKVVARVTSTLKLSVFEDRVIEIEDSLDKTMQMFVLVNEVNQTMARKSRENPSDNRSMVLIIRGLENLAYKSKQRQQALLLMNQLELIPNLNILLVCEVAPLFRLCNQSAYPRVESSEFAQADEVLAWSTLLASFTKLYDWTPPLKTRLIVNATAFDVLKHESAGWFQLNDVKRLFNKSNGTNTSDINSNWKQDQIVEFFSSHAGAIYRHKWEQCTKDERLLLFQLAGGSTVNPNNIETLEQLLRRGYVYRDCGWFIINESFRRFVIRAETEETFASWMAEINTSSWQYVRIPILVTILVLAVMIIISTGQSLQSVIAAATATLGLLPSLMRNLSFFRGTVTATHE